MWKNLPVLIALALVLALPFALKPKNDELLTPADETLVIVSPHNEAIRYEFARAFTKYEKAKTGKTVRVDWRTPGGTTEISRYLASQYLGAFEYDWTHNLHRAWSAEVNAAFDNPKIVPAANPAQDTPAQAARRAFLDSNLSSGLDLFFGGGSFDFSAQAAAGRLVDCGVIAKHPELFNEHAIPQSLGGEEYWDQQGRWIGTVLSAFGICWETDAVKRLGVPAPKEWSDLANPKYLGQLGLSNPTLSGSAAKAYEMLIQQQMQRAPTPAEGWTRAMQLLQRIGGNARYFTDAGQTVALDVTNGDASAGMTIDFFARFQSETVRKPDGSSRVGYVTPAGGSSYGVDPIGLLRGAPHRQVALDFIEFVLSIEGQKLWDYRLGAPGGPEKYALRRLPLRPELYQPEYRQYFADPEINPYDEAGKFVYHGEWTGALFRTFSFIVRVMCIDTNVELREAWAALIKANFPPQATAAFEDVSAVDFATAKTTIKTALSSPDKIQQVRLAKDLADHFRAQYRRTIELAKEGK
jgi:ABC-type Fe3+ transport system substrate-binding protein